MSRLLSKQLRASLKFDAINGDATERAICAKQMNEAAHDLDQLRNALETLVRIDDGDDPGLWKYADKFNAARKVLSTSNP